MKRFKVWEVWGRLFRGERGVGGGRFQGKWELTLVRGGEVLLGALDKGISEFGFGFGLCWAFGEGEHVKRARFMGRTTIEHSTDPWENKIEDQREKKQTEREAIKRLSG